MLFHEEEKNTVLRLTDECGNYFSPVEMAFPEGDSYICKINTAWESDNGLDEDDPNYDEYWEEWYDVVEILKRGPNLEFSISPDGRKTPILLIHYKHFPSKITFNDEVIYENKDNETQDS